jgi:type III pantothenate kinase
MLLGVEVGNTNTSFGLFTDSGDIAASYRVSTERDRMPDEWFAILTTLLETDGFSLDAVDAVVVSSVVPSVTTWLIEMARRRLGVEPLVITGTLDVGLILDVEEPRQLGADRIVDCFAARERFGAPVIVVDLGTATTIDVIGSDGAYKGGAIAAGVATSLKALAGNAAQLFNVGLSMPDRIISRNTADTLRSGIVGALPTTRVAVLRAISGIWPRKYRRWTRTTPTSTSIAAVTARRFRAWRAGWTAGRPPTTGSSGYPWPSRPHPTGWTCCTRPTSSPRSAATGSQSLPCTI